MDLKVIHLEEIKDERGSLVFAETQKEIPFDIKRIYYIFGVENSKRRGYHAHKKLEQVFILISGECKILFEDNKEKKIIHFNNPAEALYVGPGIWREMYGFSKDAVLLVLASLHYSEDDYIRDYDEFKKFVDKKEK